MSITFPDTLEFATRPSHVGHRRQWGGGLAVAVVLHLVALAAVLRYPPPQEKISSGPVIAVDVVTPPAPQKQAPPQYQNHDVSQSPHNVAAQVNTPVSLPTAVTEAAVPAATHASDAAPVRSAADAGAARASWAADVLRRLEQFKRYPAEAVEARQQGVVQLSFQMTRSGDVLSVRIARSSGYDLLDAEAVALVRRARPLPRPPEHFTGDVFDLTVPVRFSLSH